MKTERYEVTTLMHFQLTEAYSAVENDLTVLGATAVEDKLQDGVPDTIRALRQAGIQVSVVAYQGV